MALLSVIIAIEETQTSESYPYLLCEGAEACFRPYGRKSGQRKIKYFEQGVIHLFATAFPAIAKL